MIEWEQDTLIRVLKQTKMFCKQKPANKRTMKKFKKTAISLTLALLPLMTVTGQLRQENNYNAILKDKASGFYNKSLEGNSGSWYDFGFSHVTTPKDTFVCHTKIFLSRFKTLLDKSYGSIHFSVDDLTESGSGDTGTKRGLVWGTKRIKYYSQCIRYKAKAYSTFTKPGTNKPYVKCYIADITYYPVEKYRSTVKYGVKYKKYRPIEKYNVLPKDPVAAAKANAKKKERERIENIKYEKWSDKQIKKINKKLSKQNKRRRGKVTGQNSRDNAKCLKANAKQKTSMLPKSKDDDSVDIDTNYHISGAYNDSIKKAQEELKCVLRPCECKKCRKCKCTKQDCQF